MLQTNKKSIETIYFPKIYQWTPYHQVVQLVCHVKLECGCKSLMLLVRLRIFTNHNIFILSIKALK